MKYYLQKIMNFATYSLFVPLKCALFAKKKKKIIFWGNMKTTMKSRSATAQESFSSHDAAKSALHAWKATAREVKNHL